MADYLVTVSFYPGRNKLLRWCGFSDSLVLHPMKGSPMLIRNVTLDQFRAIVESVSADLYDGNVIVHPDMYESGVRIPRLTGRIRVESSRGSGARASWSGRRTVSACWHAHRDVYRAVFAQYPNATIRTTMALYTAGNFESVYPGTAWHNIGSMMAPAYMPQLCEC